MKITVPRGLESGSYHSQLQNRQEYMCGPSGNNKRSICHSTRSPRLSLPQSGIFPSTNKSLVHWVALGPKLPQIPTFGMYCRSVFSGDSQFYECLMNCILAPGDPALAPSLSGSLGRPSVYRVPFGTRSLGLGVFGWYLLARH